MLRSIRAFVGSGSIPENFSKLHPAEIAQVRLLKQKQSRFLAEILEELEASGRKRTHWIWWVMPTTKPGDGEPGEGTFVTTRTAAFLFQGAEPMTDEKLQEEDDLRARLWQEILEKIAKLQVERVLNTGSVEKKKPRATSTILPSVDHGRVHFFVKFWVEHPKTPQWLQKVCDQLGRFDWGYG